MLRIIGRGGHSIKQIKLILYCILGSAFLVSACSADKAKEPLEIDSSIMYERDTQAENVEEAEQIGCIGTAGFLVVDMDTKKIVIPSGYISSVYKDIYSAKKKIYDSELISMICRDINNSEIAQISIDYQEIIKKEGLGDYLQYPIVLETGCEEEYAAIGLLAQEGTDYYVQLKLTISADNLMNANSYSLIQPTESKRYINCFVKSEELYHDVINFWGDRISLNDIQKPERIEVSNNSSNSVYAGRELEETVDFTEADAEKFTEGLLADAYAVYDDHSFGITLTIRMADKNCVELYYADDGCSMFQLDGVSYNLKPEGEAAAVMRKYIRKLEEK